MKREIVLFKNRTFDVLVVGGGIHGAAVAHECALQGMSVALIEKNDFGSVTSANSLKIIHGGFRYLQHLNIKRMRESILSRKIMLQVSPHNIEPLQCVIPTSGKGIRNKWIMSVALMINDIIGFDRNAQVSEKKKIPKGSILNLNECAKIFPKISWNGYTGGACWFDALAINSERLTLDFVKESTKYGSIVSNYLSMQEFIVESGKVKGAKVLDEVTGERFSIMANSVVVTSGASNDRVLGTLQNRKYQQEKWALAVNIIVKKNLVEQSAIGLTGEENYIDNDAILKKKGRFFFFVPWRGYTMIGTTYTFKDNNEGLLHPEKHYAAEILEEIRHLFPDENIRIEDVTKVHAGYVPAYSTKDNDEVQLVKETQVEDLSMKMLSPTAGLFSVKSVKYTTAPVVAREVASRISEYLNLKDTINRPADRYKEADIAQGLKATNVDMKILEQRYGKNIRLVGKYLEKDQNLICDAPLLYGGEIDYFIEEEMALKLEDVVFRRSDVGTAEIPPRAILELIAGKMGQRFDWTKSHIIKEINSVEKLATFV